MKKIISVFLFLTFISCIYAQENLPTDYLSKEFHKGRREAFRNLMPANSMALVFSYPERTFSNDVNYVFHQNPDLYYLSGYKEPNAVLVIFKEMQGQDDTAYNEIFFVRERDKARETWTGRRLGVEGTKTQLGFAKVYEGKYFKSFAIDYKKFSKIICDEIPTDVPNDNSGYDLFGLLQSVKEKIVVEQDNVELHKELQFIAKVLTISNLPDFIKYEKEQVERNKIFKDDPFINQILKNPDSATLESIKATLKSQKWGLDYYQDITSTLREIKTPEELVMIRKSVKLSSIAHSEVMKAVTPNMSEREAEGIQAYIHRKYDAEDEGYPPIVGAGANGCILHYEENSNTKINNQLLLMDVGAMYHGYSADVTRTIPANGKFTVEQKAIYQLVYNAQEEIFKLCKEGTPYNALNKKAQEILANGLIKLGIIKDKNELGTYYPHGCSHYIGLDVHDKGNYGPLKENMVITVEPGIYIPANSNCDKKWWNIGVRIEDDVLILKTTFELLSAAAPRKWQDIETMAAVKSKFNEMVLPKL